MRIFKIKKNWTAMLPLLTTYKIGERFFEEVKDGERIYYPERGYPVWEREDFKFVDEYFEFMSESDKPKEYFTNKKYTQEQMDSAINKSYYESIMGQQ